MQLQFGFITDRGLNPKRPVNQDSYLALPESGLFAVFDGVGGQRAGEIASQTAAETIAEAFAQPAQQSPAEQIRRAIEFANRDIFEMAEGNQEYKTMATTVALAHFEGEQVTIAHVGDSRVYLLDNGRLSCETMDHTDANDAVRAGQLTAAQAAKQASRNVINRALGAEPEVEVEIKTVRLREGAQVLLCSDGIHKHLRDTELYRLLSENADPQRAAEKLKEIVYQRGADDNLTAIIVRCGRAARQPSPTVSAPARNTGKLKPRQIRSSSSSRIQVEFGDRAEATDSFSDSNERWSSDAGEAEGRKQKFTRWLIYLLLGVLLVATGFYAGLRASGFRQPSSSDAPAPNATAAELQSGREAFEVKEYQAALSRFEAALRREPQNAEAAYWLGRARLELGDYAKALESFEHALRLKPETSEAYIYAAFAAYKLEGRSERFEKILRDYNARQRPGEAPASNGRTGNR